MRQYSRLNDYEFGRMLDRKKYAFYTFNKYIMVDTNSKLTWIGGRDKVADVMTDMQFKTILNMVDMILDGCKDLDEAKEKVRKLVKEQETDEKQ